VEAIAGARTEGYDSLRDWYAADVARADIGLGRVLCQRSNLYWDGGLRTRYVYLLLFLLAALVVSITALALYLDATVLKFVAGLLLPCLPLIELLVRQSIEHRQTIADTRRLIGKIDPVIDTLCAKKTVTGLKVVTRTFQDEMFRHRKSCPLVLDGVYWRLRGRQEKEMQFSLKRKIDECLGA